MTPSILTTPNRRTKSWSSRSHNADGPLTAGVTQADNAAGTLVERGQTSTQVGWVAGIGRHLSQTTGDFSQGLSPSGSGVGHHGDIETHVTEILGQRDPCSSTISPLSTSLNKVTTDEHKHQTEGYNHHNNFPINSIFKQGDI